MLIRDGEDCVCICATPDTHLHPGRVQGVLRSRWYGLAIDDDDMKVDSQWRRSESVRRGQTPLSADGVV